MFQGLLINPSSIKSAHKFTDLFSNYTVRTQLNPFLKAASPYQSLSLLREVPWLAVLKALRTFLLALTHSWHYLFVASQLTCEFKHVKVCVCFCLLSRHWYTVPITTQTFISINERTSLPVRLLHCFSYSLEKQ